MVKMYLSPLPLNMVLNILGNPIRQESKIRGIWIVKKDVKLFRGDMFIYVENQKKKKMTEMELIRQYRNVAGYKINTPKPITFLYNSQEQVEIEN